MFRTAIICCLLGFAIQADSHAASVRPDRITALRISPSVVVLDGRTSRQQLLVEGIRADGQTVDLTPEADTKVSPLTSSIVRLEDGTVALPVRDGRSALIVRAGGLQSTVPVVVSNMGRPFHWTFANHVESVFSKQGCNMGACHGAAAGKGGFRLSLRAYDPDADYVRLRLEGRGRRIVKTIPDESLILKKPSLATSHVGGLRLKQDSLEYRVVQSWISDGAPGPSKRDAHIASLEVLPRERILLPAARQQLLVTARFSDGHREDVTHWARYSSNEEPIARVDDRGLVTMRGCGETVISVWYLGKVAFARLGVPFDGGRRTADVKSGSVAVNGAIDRLVNAKLQRLGLRASPRCADAEFVRRVYLDAIGTLPTPAETRAFLADSDPRKRETLIESLLERPEYTDFWTYRWADMLRINRDLVGAKGMASLYGWMRNNVAQNRPWDRIAYDLITASGTTSAGPANFYRMGTKPEEFAETVSQTFLGIRVQCAHCHNHPFEKWTQTDYYRMANFFARVKRTETGGQDFVRVASAGDVDHPKLHRPMAPAPFDGPQLALEDRGDRREFLAKWVTAPENPYFARTLVNRIWKQCMGRGLVEPVDDMRLTNPASNEPLLAELTKEFTESGYDAKKMMCTILLSDTYQRSARTDASNRPDDRFYSHYLPRRIPAEALLDAVCQVTGAPEKFAGMPKGTRAISLPDTHIASDFLDLFGRPARQVTCECERNMEPNMAQALHLITAATLNGKISAKDGTLAKLATARKSDMEIVEELYLACFSRKPTPSEHNAVSEALATAGGKTPEEIAAARQQVFADLLWAMLSSPEFVYNH